MADNTHKLGKKLAKLLSELKGHRIEISAIIGGTLFLEIDFNASDLDKHTDENMTKVYDAVITSGDDWSVVLPSGEIIYKGTRDTWGFDPQMDSYGPMTISDITIEGNFDVTTFIMNNGLRVILKRDDELMTLGATFYHHHVGIIVNGDGTFTQWNNMHKPEPHKIRKRPPESPTIEIARSFLRSQCPDPLPISREKALSFVSQIIDHTVHAIDIMSGIKYCLNIGEQLTYYDRFLKKDAQIHRYSLYIEDASTITQDAQTFNTSVSRFHIEKPLKKMLLNKSIRSVSFDEKGNNLQITYSDGIIGICDTGREDPWSFQDRKTGLMLGSGYDMGLYYRISSRICVTLPDSGDVHLDSILTELNFYRDYFRK